ncbi:MAG: hypothetical protein DRN91_06035 [Candidatus Alkanophagales archaeon]|nr:MAG: hypothetical protein DRN91_06035 [Candidatus Alkanophagales archaeon]
MFTKIAKDTFSVELSSLVFSVACRSLLKESRVNGLNKGSKVPMERKVFQAEQEASEQELVKEIPIHFEVVALLSIRRTRLLELTKWQINIVSTL